MAIAALKWTGAGGGAGEEAGGGEGKECQRKYKQDATQRNCSIVYLIHF